MYVQHVDCTYISTKKGLIKGTLDYHHQILLLLVDHTAYTKNFQTLRSPGIPVTSFHDVPVLLISSSIVILHALFGLLLFLYIMFVQSNSIFFFLSDFLLTSDG